MRGSGPLGEPIRILRCERARAPCAVKRRLAPAGTAIPQHATKSEIKLSAAVSVQLRTASLKPKGGGLSAVPPRTPPSPALLGHLPLGLSFPVQPRIRGASSARSPWGERESVQAVGARSLAASSAEIRASERLA